MVSPLMILEFLVARRSCWLRAACRWGLVVMAAGVVSCASSAPPSSASREILISVKDQKLALMEQGRPVAVYPVSTSKFGLSDTPGSYGTPLGRMKVAQKIGGGAPLGAVFKHRQRTGEVLPPNAPGRDPIVTRILRLTGQERGNARAFARNIYIHGTPEESTIGRPASFGCVRMKSPDVVDLFDRVPNGTEVTITKARLPGAARVLARRQITPAGILRPGQQLVARLRPPAAKVPENQLTARYGPPAP
jgi:hypothetical protein